MLKISDFSKLSGISIRMLRFYDEKDILKPCRVEENGYRFYDVKQLRLAINIHYFRYFDFSTNEIKTLLKELKAGKNIQEILNERLEKLQTDSRIISEKIRSLQMTIDTMNQEEIVMNYNVEVKEFPSCYMMCKRDVIPSYDKEGLLWKGLSNELRSTGRKINFKQNGLAMAVFYDEGYKDSDVDVEIRIEVNAEDYEDSENIKFRWIDPVKVASITFNGGYEHISEICIQIAKWLSDNNFEIAGPNFSIYHVGYEQTQNPNEFVTEICYPYQ